MKKNKILLGLLVIGLAVVPAYADLNVGVEQPINSIELQPVEPPSMSSCEKQEITEIKDSAKVNHYDNVPIFEKNKDRKINIILKQPSASLGTQQ